MCASASTHVLLSSLAVGVLQVLASLPFTLVCNFLYAGVWYGMGGLQSGAVHFARFACLITLMNLIASQVRR